MIAFEPTPPVPHVRAARTFGAPLVFAPDVMDADAPSSRRAMSPEAAARFRRLVDEHFAVVWRFLRGLGVPSAGVDDAAQHVFLTASQRIGDINVGSERAFLFATARGVAANARRTAARSREVHDDDALALLRDEGADPETALASGQARALLYRLLAELDDDAREVFVLFELEGLATATIAADLGLPAGTVASRLRRAREGFEAATKRFRARTARTREGEP